MTRHLTENRRKQHMYCIQRYSKEYEWETVEDDISERLAGVLVKEYRMAEPTGIYRMVKQ